MPKIIVQKGTEIIKTYNLPNKEVVTIGSSSGCDVPIEDPAVAAEQAKIVLQEDGFHLQLVTHIPPVFVTEERVEGDIKLEDGDTVRIEEYNLILNILEGEVKIEEEPPPPEPEPKPEPPEPAPKPESVPVEAVVESESKKDVVQAAINNVIKEKEKLSDSEQISSDQKQKAKPEIEKPEPIRKSEPEISVVKTEELGIEPDVTPAQPVKPPPVPKPEPPEPVVEEKKETPAAPKPKPVVEEKPEPPPLPEPEPIVPEKSEPAQPAPEPVVQEPEQPDDRKTKVMPILDADKPEPVQKPKPVRRELKMFLLAIDGPHKGEQHELRQAENNIGRDRQKNNIVVRLTPDGSADKSISRQHAKISYQDKQYYLSDPGSQMRTKINGRIISTSEKVALSAGDLIEICSVKENTVFRFAVEGHLDFSLPQSVQAGILSSNMNLKPVIIIAAAVIVVVVILILIFK